MEREKGRSENVNVAKKTKLEMLKEKNVFCFNSGLMLLTHLKSERPCDESVYLFGTSSSSGVKIKKKEKKFSLEGACTLESKKTAATYSADHVRLSVSLFSSAANVMNWMSSFMLWVTISKPSPFRTIR